VRIEKITLSDFRNATRVEFAPGPGANVIYGDNAQGKTNILEAIWLFSGARSFRGARDDDFIRFNADSAKLELDFYAKGREQTASITVAVKKKTVLLNGIKQSGQSKLAGEFCCVLFSPDHLLLVKQGPENRRRMIDLSLCQTFPKYADILDAYHKILKQRASLLRDIPRHPALLETLDIWDQSLIEYGAYIIWLRARYIKKLAPLAADVYRGISGEKEQLSLAYRPAIGNVEADFQRADYKETFQRAVKTGRRDDIDAGKTLCGPHRDDIDILIDGVSARAFGSQGQQRSCVLALKLAECGILEERNAEPPVVLLDDVMSELDDSRRSYLLQKFEGMQVIITCCDRTLFTGIGNGRVFHVSEGTLSAE
jgi:DNA replication and repair protein RecF